MLVYQNVGLEIEDRFLFRHLTITLENQKYGLLGPNGVGKSSLARLALQEIEPTEGHVLRDGTVGYFSQEAILEKKSVGEYLISIWEDSNEFSRELIDEIPLDRCTSDLSGGEWMRIRLAKLLSEKHSFLILDEPTNNLDRLGRELIMKVVRQWKLGILVISHDRELLNLMDQTLELSNQGLTVYGGNFNFYWQVRQKERAIQKTHLERTKKATETKVQEKVDKIDRQRKRMARGKKIAAKGGEPKILLGARKRQAQQSLGLIETHERKRVETAIETEVESWNSMKVDPFLRLHLESAQVPSRQVVSSACDLNFHFSHEPNPLWEKNLNFLIQGSARVQIRGANGAGKTTLLKLMMGESSQSGKISGETIGELKQVRLPFAYLSQKSNRDESLSILESLMDSSRFSPTELRNELAFFGFTDQKVFQPMATLSGGEKLKANLARIFLGRNIPQVLFLDEPTNHMDLQSLGLLQEALVQFHGCLILVSHDQAFVEDCGITQMIDV